MIVSPLGRHLPVWSLRVTQPFWSVSFAARIPRFWGCDTEFYRARGFWGAPGPGSSLSSLAAATGKYTLFICLPRFTACKSVRRQQGNEQDNWSGVHEERYECASSCWYRQVVKDHPWPMTCFRPTFGRRRSLQNRVCPRHAHASGAAGALAACATAAAACAHCTGSAQVQS